MKYTDEKLQEHELNFWINSYNPPFPHLSFYKSFFNFSKLSGKKTIDIGCGGAPISDYCGVSDINLTIVDPLIDKLILCEKFKHLSKYNYHSNSLFELNENDYEYLICLNVVDHFNDPTYNFVDKFSSLLKKDGIMWLYYDVRDVDDGEHLSINNDLLLKTIKNHFEIVEISDSINPTHKGWSSVNNSIRLIAKKK